MRYTDLFVLHRDEDPTGRAGTVAYGAILPGGGAIVRWTGDMPSTVYRKSFHDAEKVHTSDGRTSIRVLTAVNMREREEAEKCLDIGVSEAFAAFLAVMDYPPADLEKPVRALVRAARHQAPIDFEGQRIPAFMEDALLSEMFGAGTSG